NYVSILFGNGDGTFRTPVNYSTGAGPRIVKVADLNGDGILDLAVTNTGSNNVSILLGNPDGTFKAAMNYAVGGNPATVAVGDLNGDGKLDLAVSYRPDCFGEASGSVSLLLGNGDGTFNPGGTLQMSYDGSGCAGPTDPLPVLIADLNGDGRM